MKPVFVNDIINLVRFFFFFNVFLYIKINLLIFATALRVGFLCLQDLYSELLLDMVSYGRLVHLLVELGEFY